LISYTGWDRDYTEYEKEYQKILRDSLDKDTENVEFLEHRILEYIPRKCAVAVASATDALHFSLLCHGIGQGDEVLVTDFSWISTASCISMVGATPVFCDIDLESYHISLKSIEKMVIGRSGKVKALIYTHLFGNMTDSTAIQKFCQENNIIFIEDAAQSLGSSLNGVVAGTIGDCSSISFNTNKVISGLSGGGVFLTDNERHADTVRMLRRCGKGKDFEMLGRNSKMGYVNARIISSRMNRMKELQNMRQWIAKRYDDAMDVLPVKLSPLENNLNHNYHKYVIRLETPEIRENLRDSFQVHYDTPLSENSMYDKINHRKDNCVNAKLASQTVISLPIHPWLKRHEVDQIIDKLWREL
jgi:dTDP-4-amino-4,6-dideoxygalactose transaminase